MSLTREVRSHVAFDVYEPTAFVLAMAVAEGVPRVSESLEIRLDGRPIRPIERPDLHGARLHLFDAGAGQLEIDYATTVVGRAAAAEVGPNDAIYYLRPSRYVQSDVLTPLARELFGRKPPLEQLHDVTEWVASELTYVPEASSPIGGAVETLELKAGVCRDYAHVTAAFLRALDIPARLVSVYAPQLDPMDFHAVVEALIDEQWVIVDASRLAPRTGMVRIATGRDAADTAFETNTLADVDLVRLWVTATADTELADDPDQLVQLG